MEKKVKKYVTQILCVLSAIVLWLFVTYTEDPQMHLWVRNVPISYVGGEELAARGLTPVSDEMPQAVSVKVTGRKSALRRMETSSVRASVSYATVNDAGQHTLPVHIALSDGDLRVEKLSFQRVAFQCDSLVTVDKTISVTAEGAENLGIHSFASYPPTVQLTGPKSILSQLKAGVFVDLSGKDAADEYTVTLTDEEGKRYEGDFVTVANDKVTISATRTLPVEIQTANEPQNRTVKSISYSPQTVDIRGELSALLQVEKIEGNHPVWMDFGAASPKSGPVQLVYPENVQILGPETVEATFEME